jgi:hypothetical protein
MSLTSARCAIRGGDAMAISQEFSQSDMARYRDLIATIDLQDSQKDEVIRIVRSIMQAFIDVAFEMHPAQLSSKSQAKDSSHLESSHAKLTNNQEMKSEFGVEGRLDLDSKNAKDVLHGKTGTSTGRHILPG